MSRWARTLTTEEPNSEFDLDDWVGQRSATFRFDFVDNVTGYRIAVNPLRTSIPVLTHNTERTIKRQITGLLFGVTDTALFNSITTRLEPFMVLGGVDYPLGRYLPNSQLRYRSTAGTQSNAAFYDEGFIVDQEFTESFGSLVAGESISFTIERALETLPILFHIEPSSFTGTFGWSTGTRRGYAVEQLAIDGDYFSPWFDHQSVMQFIRSFDPEDAIPTFDLDSGNKVIRERIVESDDLINAPNRFVVVSNGAAGQSAAISGTYDVPASAPHSIANRGFVVQATLNRQVDNVFQAEAVARNIGQRQTVFQTVELYTAPDPRHDSYDVLRWSGLNWLEIAWSLPLVEGSLMQHVGRRSYI